MCLTLVSGFLTAARRSEELRQEMEIALITDDERQELTDLASFHGVEFTPYV